MFAGDFHISNKALLVGVSILAYLPFVAWIVWLTLRAARRMPKIPPAEARLFDESTASGCSDRNFLTRLGGANNCLRIAVTRDAVWITTWRLFFPIAAVWDLAHYIPKQSIVSLEQSRRMRRDVIRLAYTSPEGLTRAVLLAPRNRAKFLSAIGVPPKLG